MKASVSDRELLKGTRIVLDLGYLGKYVIVKITKEVSLEDRIDQSNSLCKSLLDKKSESNINKTFNKLKELYLGNYVKYIPEPDKFGTPGYYGGCYYQYVKKMTLYKLSSGLLNHFIIEVSMSEYMDSGCRLYDNIPIEYFSKYMILQK